MQKSSIRSLIEKASRSLSFRRKLPKEFSSVPIVVSPSAGLKYLFKPMSKVDPTLFRCVREIVRPGDVVWDIGANIGLFAFAAASISGSTGSVVAFEPDVWLVQLLRRSQTLQPPSSARIMVVPIAVASQVALRQFEIAVRSRASNALAGYGHSQTGGVAEVQMVPAFNLDWLLSGLPEPAVIKCDVEDAELEVFRDQVKIFSEIRPIVLCEVGEQSSAEITHLLLEHDYALFDGEISLIGASEIPRATWNTVAVPRERKLDCTSRGPR